MENVHVFVDESSHSFWAELLGKPWGLRVHELRGDWTPTQYFHFVEIPNVKQLESLSPSWTRLVLSLDQAIKCTKSRAHVDADSVLCVEQKNDSKEAIARWGGQVEELNFYLSHNELLGIHGEAIEFEWSTFWNPEEEEGQRNHTLQWRFIEHRTLVTNYSFCKSAQYLRSRGELVWTIRLERGIEGTRNFICEQKFFWQV